MSELKPCPFCGSEGAILDEPFYEDEYGCFCNKKCGAVGPCDEDGEKAIEFWNTRPIEDELRAEIDRLQAELKVTQERCDRYEENMARHGLVPVAGAPESEV